MCSRVHGKILLLVGLQGFLQDKNRDDNGSARVMAFNSMRRYDRRWKWVPYEYRVT